MRYYKKQLIFNEIKIIKFRTKKGATLFGNALNIYVFTLNFLNDKLIVIKV